MHCFVKVSQCWLLWCSLVATTTITFHWVPCNAMSQREDSADAINFYPSSRTSAYLPKRDGSPHWHLIVSTVRPNWDGQKSQSNHDNDDAQALHCWTRIIIIIILMTIMMKILRHCWTRTQLRARGRVGASAAASLVLLSGDQLLHHDNGDDNDDDYQWCGLRRILNQT